MMYPEYNIVNFDKLDYCSSLNNNLDVENHPNYTFIKVRSIDHGNQAVLWYLSALFSGRYYNSGYGDVRCKGA